MVTRFALCLIILLTTSALCQSADIFIEVNNELKEARRLIKIEKYAKAEKLLIGALLKIDTLGPDLRTAATKPLALLAVTQFAGKKEKKARANFYKALDLATSISNDGLFFETAYLVLESTKEASGAAHALRELLHKLEGKKDDDEQKTKARMIVAAHCVLGRHALKNKHAHSAISHYQKAYRLAKEIEGKIVTASKKNSQMLSLIPLIFAETGLAATFNAMGHQALAKRYTLKLLHTLRRTLKFKVLEKHVAVESARQMLLRTVRK